MAKATLLSAEEYLRTSLSPDCDYVDGELEERNVGEFQHARIQQRLAAYFGARERDWGIVGAPELRVQVSPDRFRVADYCVLAQSAPREQVIATPPLLAIEILSPEDRVSRTEERIEDFLAMGVPYVWLIDPTSRRAWVYTPGQRTEAREGMLHANPPIEMPWTELFDEA
ncbi:MAG: Uma2 family endonuclease [Bryobacter sp.]|nr:Uma2 family endonuclease [Bryobacter sp.]